MYSLSGVLLGYELFVWAERPNKGRIEEKLSPKITPLATLSLKHNIS